MATNNKRREATRRQLEQQLRERQRRQAARKRTVLIASISATLVVIAAVVIVVIHYSGNSPAKNTASSKANQAAGAPSTTPTPTPTPTSTPTPSPTTVAKCTPPTGKVPAGSSRLDGVTVGNATNLKTEPKVRSCSPTDPSALEYKDLVVGKGAAANPKSGVTVQYTGVLYKNGTEFDSSWARHQSAQFSLTGVVPGFTQGIGGNGSKVPPMHVGGRRIVILPASLGYGAQASGSIPANSSLVFVIDLLKVGKATSSTG